MREMKFMFNSLKIKMVLHPKVVERKESKIITYDLLYTA
jgi:hypothetical protein